MRHRETVELRGHIFDTGVLARVLGDVVEYGCDYRLERLTPGRGGADKSVARMEISAEDPEQLSRILMRLQTHGVNPVEPGNAVFRPAPRDGVFPEDFYSTTNLDTQIHVGGRWLDVANAEMDCGSWFPRRHKA